MRIEAVRRLLLHHIERTRIVRIRTQLLLGLDAAAGLPMFGRERASRHSKGEANF